VLGCYFLDRPVAAQCLKRNLGLELVRKFPSFGHFGIPSSRWNAP